MTLSNVDTGPIASAEGQFDEVVDGKALRFEITNVADAGTRDAKSFGSGFLSIETSSILRNRCHEIYLDRLDSRFLGVKSEHFEDVGVLVLV
jgi:hypothetical protein